MWDVFISHASEDKAAVVRPLVRALADRGLSCWFDETTLKVGDSLTERIDHGLAVSRYAVVVLSKHFFSREWPREELRGLRMRQLAGERVLLPVWHEVTPREVRAFSLPLADIVALPTHIGIDEVADQIASRVGGGVVGRDGERPIGLVEPMDYLHGVNFNAPVLDVRTPDGYAAVERLVAALGRRPPPRESGLIFVPFGVQRHAAISEDLALRAGRGAARFIANRLLDETRGYVFVAGPNALAALCPGLDGLNAVADLTSTVSWEVAGPEPPSELPDEVSIVRTVIGLRLMRSPTSITELLAAPYDVMRRCSIDNMSGGHLFTRWPYR